MYRTFCGVTMNGAQIWLVIAVLQALLLTATCVKHHHRRSMATQQSLPVSKGGWRPVVGSSGLVFGFGTAPLHAQSYKIPVPVLDSYPSSARPLSTRDATKLTSIAQSYRPTTLRTVPAGHSVPAASQPINTYLNPFAISSNGLNHYKYVHNYPSESVLIRNPHNPFAARPVYPKYQNKFKQQQYPQQQLPNTQTFQSFNAQSTSKPVDSYGKPVENYARQDGKKPTSDIEMFKPEVFKLTDSDTASQSVNQQVKTAQQSLTNQKAPLSPFQQYTYQDSIFPPSILGTFGSFGVQSVKGRDPLHPLKGSFIQQQPSKQTIFNSFSFAPNFKTTPTVYISTTPKLQTTPGQTYYGSTWNDYRTVPTQAPKQQAVSPAKIDPNTNKGTFKPSPQDPFITKFNNADYNKVSTYKPNIAQTTTFAYNNFHDYKYNTQPNPQYQNFYNQQQEAPVKKKQKIHDSLAQLTDQQNSQQYANPPKREGIEATPQSVPFRATYEVTEIYDSDGVTHSSTASWPTSSETQKVTEEVVTRPEYDTAHSRPSTPSPDLTEEFAIVTEAEKGYDNSLRYDNPLETQSRRPVGDDFEPIGKHKLKDYYYKVTPTYEEHSSRRTKKPTESSKFSVQEVTTHINAHHDNEVPVEALPTLPPNKHFKRPSTVAPTEKDRVRKRNKLRRRRPPLANINRDHESSTRYVSTTEPSDEVHTIKPRVRPTQSKPQLTTPTTSTDLSTSAVPTVSPTSPTIVKKKLINRRPYTTTTTTEKPEPTSPTYKEHDSDNESPIMKISASSRPHLPKISTTPLEYRSSEMPDYSHKQDEKDTPTSDIAVSISDTLKTASSGGSKNFSFHRDAKPIEAKLELVKEHTTEAVKDSNEVNDATTTTRVETSSVVEKVSRPRLKNKFNRPNFSVKDYRNRLSSTTSTTEKPVEQNIPKIRFPHRRVPVSENETITERKKFTPKDPRHKINASEHEQNEKEIHSLKPNRYRQTTVETTEATTQKVSSRVRNGSRRPKPTEADQTTETTSSTTVHIKRPLRKKIKDIDQGESVQDISVTETTASNSDITSERARSESAIMKIADKKHPDHFENLFEHSKRVSDLTLAASKDYNTPGMFKTVSASSRRIPNYFTIATDDPILPIEAFFPQINQKKES